MIRVKRSLIAMSLASLATCASASDLQINGFMNVTLGVSSNDEIEVDGYDEGMSATNNSIVGLQFFKRVNDSTSATVQLVARGADAFNTEAAWAYVTYSFDENTDVRVGRLRTPFYHYSDFLEVGYAYNWVTPSSIIYLDNQLSSLNGTDITRRFTFGPVDGFVQAYTGRYVGPFTLGPDDYTADIPVTGIVASGNMGNFAARVSFHQGLVSLDLDPTGARGLDQFLAGAIGTESFNLIPGLESSDFVADRSKADYFQTSLAYDNGTTSFITEYTKLEHETAVLNDNFSFMVGGAQRFGETTIHLTYIATEDSLEDGATGIFQANAENKENSIILGARYDYDAGTAFKLEAERHDEELKFGQEGSMGIIYRAGFSLAF